MMQRFSVKSFFLFPAIFGAVDLMIDSVPV
jgi:hypothetical protein